MAPKTKPQITQAQQEALNRDLLLAARDGHFDGVLIALEDGANVQAKFGDQELSALHLAALKGDVKLASYLLNRGADIEARSIEGDRALHLAALANHPRMVEFLLANGADVNVQNVDGISPLHCARFSMPGLIRISWAIRCWAMHRRCHLPKTLWANMRARRRRKWRTRSRTAFSVTSNRLNRPCRKPIRAKRLLTKIVIPWRRSISRACGVSSAIS